MKLLYIAGEVVPGNNGGAVHVWEVASGLSRLGYEVTLLLHQQKGQKIDEELSGIRILRTNMELRSKRVPLLGIKRLPRLLKQDYEVIMDRYITTGGCGMILSRLMHVPLVLEVNSPHVEELLWRYKIKNTLIKKVLRGWVNLQFRQAKDVLATLKTAVPPAVADKTRIVEWGVNTEKFSPDSKDDSRCKAIVKDYGLRDKTVVLFVGSFRRWHGVHHLIPVAEYVLKRNRNISFLLVGGGELAEEAEIMIIERGLQGSVILTGCQDYDMIPYFMGAADIGIAPFDLDEYPPLKQFGFFWSPLKIFEYMASGLPVITVQCDTLNRLVGSCRGITVPSGDIKGYGNAVLNLAQNPERARETGRNARKFAEEHYSWDHHVKKLDAFLKEAACIL